ncbi:MAG: hypothetical protein U0132_08935 [Gemmatimonadaceae bacterium]
MRAFLLRAAPLVLAVAIAAPAFAQTSVQQQSAYRALIYTPVGGLAPLPPSGDTSSRRPGRILFQGRMGHMSRRGGLSLTSVGLGVEAVRGRWNLGGSFAYLSASCGLEWEGDSDCSGDVMFGASARTTLLVRPLDGSAPATRGRRAASNGSEFVLGLDGSGGYSPRQGEQALAGALATPLGVRVRNGTTVLMPFLSPGIGYGRMGHTSYDGELATSYGGMAFMIGGGLGVEFRRSGLGANVGFQRVLKGEGGGTQLGIGMTWQGAPVSR